MIVYKPKTSKKQEKRSKDTQEQRRALIPADHFIGSVVKNASITTDIPKCEMAKVWPALHSNTSRGTGTAYISIKFADVHI